MTAYLNYNNFDFRENFRTNFSWTSLNFYTFIKTLNGREGERKREREWENKRDKERSLEKKGKNIINFYSCVKCGKNSYCTILFFLYNCMKTFFFDQHLFIYLAHIYHVKFACVFGSLFTFVFEKEKFLLWDRKKTETIDRKKWRNNKFI